MRDYFDEVKDLYQEKVQDIAADEAGQQRKKRGVSVESICEVLVAVAWHRAGGKADRLSFGTNKYKLKIKDQPYLDKLEPALKEYIEREKDKYFYEVQVDSHVLIDGKLVMGVECKSYTENAMLKRIMVDFTFLKKLEPNLIHCVLLQLESSLGGDYEKARESVIGSTSSHSIMSYFCKVHLHILTLLEGARSSAKPVFEKDNFKELKRENVEHAVEKLNELLAQFV
ncbi:MAG: hypothetical protein ACNYPD_07110 [Candidatus Halichondribacter symbioticus]